MAHSEITDETTTTTGDDPRAMVQQFFGRWSNSKVDALAAFDEFFTRDTVLENVGLATTVGIDEAKAFAENTPPGFDTMVAEVKLIVSQRPYVFSERVDDVYNAAGELLASARGVGVADVKNGRIVAHARIFRRERQCPGAGHLSEVAPFNRRKVVLPCRPAFPTARRCSSTTRSRLHRPTRQGERIGGDGVVDAISSAVSYMTFTRHRE